MSDWNSRLEDERTNPEHGRGIQRRWDLRQFISHIRAETMAGDVCCAVLCCVVCCRLQRTAGTWRRTLQETHQDTLRRCWSPCSRYQNWNSSFSSLVPHKMYFNYRKRHRKPFLIHQEIVVYWQLFGGCILQIWFNRKHSIRWIQRLIPLDITISD